MALGAGADSLRGLRPEPGAEKGTLPISRREKCQSLVERTKCLTCGPQISSMDGVTFPTDSFPQGVFSGWPGCEGGQTRTDVSSSFQSRLPRPHRCLSAA